MSNRGKFYIGSNVDTFNVMPVPGNVVKVILNIDETSYVQSPAIDDGAVGITVEADCPYATQAIADSVLSMLQTRDYSPYTADNAALDPSAELGDGITSNGVYSGIYSFSKNFSRRSEATISAPINSETEHEFQYTEEQERKFVRQAKETSSELALRMKSIYAKVTGPATSFGWELKEDSMEWYSNGMQVMKLDSTGLTISGTVTAHAIITGDLEVGGQVMDADVLGGGALDGYSWMNDYDYSYGGTSYTGAGYTLSGGLGGFQYNTSTDYWTTSYPAYFRCGSLQLGSNFFSGSVVVTIGGNQYRLVGFALD